MASKPDLSSTCRAVATSNSAIVAPPRLSTSPKRAIPSARRSARGLRRDLDLLADLVPLVIGRVQVDHDLIRAGGPVALDELERVEALVLGLDAEAEGRIVALDRLPVAVEDLRLVGVAGEVEDRAGGRPRPRAARARARAPRPRRRPCPSATTRRASCPRRPRPSARTSSRRSSRTPSRSCP